MTASSRATAGMVPVMPAATTGMGGACAAPVGRERVEQQAPAQARRRAGPPRPGSPASRLAQQPQEDQRFLPVLGQDRRAPARPGGRARPPRCAARRGSAPAPPRAAPPARAPSSGRARRIRRVSSSRRRIGPIAGGSDSSISPSSASSPSSGSPIGTRRGSSSGWPPRARRNASRAARQARRLGSSTSVSASRSRSQASSPSTRAGRNGRSASMVWTSASSASQPRSARPAARPGSSAAQRPLPVKLGAPRLLAPLGHRLPGRSVRRSAGHSQGARSGHSTSSAPRRQHSSSPSSAISLGSRDAVEVGVADLQPGQRVALQQREGRARHRDRRAGQRCGSPRGRARSCRRPDRPRAGRRCPAPGDPRPVAASAWVAARSGRNRLRSARSMPGRAQ